jgi:hypothetical protein
MDLGTSIYLKKENEEQSKENKKQLENSQMSGKLKMKQDSLFILSFM